MNVGFSDGHAETISATEEIYKISYRISGSGPGDIDGFHYQMFLFFDTRDFTKIHTLFAKYL